MAHETTPPAPGSMTVPPLFGWEVIATALALVVVLAVVFLVLASTRASAEERSEWQAWLDARSSRRHDPAAWVGADVRPAPTLPISGGRTGRGS